MQARRSLVKYDLAIQASSARLFVDALYGQMLESGIKYFWPASRLSATGPASSLNPDLVSTPTASGQLELEWLGIQYVVSKPDGPFTIDQRRLVRKIGEMLTFRYRLLAQADLALRGLHLFRGVPEDRYVSAFLDSKPYASIEALTETPDRVAEAIEVLRVSSLSTYENRRIATGVLLFGNLPDDCHALPDTPVSAVPYSSALTAIRSFHRLCDGLQTVALVDRAGLLSALVEVQEWARPYADFELTVPTATQYKAHARSTLCGGHICLILTPNGEIKIFSNGMQVFNFLDGRWRLTDAMDKYLTWVEHVGEPRLAERLFAVALDLAEDRRGALIVVLDEPESASRLVAAQDLISAEPRPGDGLQAAQKHELHYLLRNKRLLDLAPPILESVARIDGAIVLDRSSNLLAFGAILRSHTDGPGNRAMEGGRTTAAMLASKLGKVLKVSEDGLVSFYEGGRCVWEM